MFDIHKCAKCCRSIIEIANNKLAYLYALLILPILCFGLLLTPPIQSADENAHFTKASDVASGRLVAHNGTILIDGKEKIVCGNIVDKALNEFISIQSYLTFDLTSKVDTEKFQKSSKIEFTGEKTFAYSTVATYSPIFYLPAAISIRISKIFSDKVITSLYAARLGTLICFLILSFFCLKISNNFFNVFFLTLPAAISYGYVCTIDSIMLAATLLIVNLIKYKKYKKVAYFLIVSMMIQKTAYAPFYLLIFTPGYFFENQSRRNKIVIATFPLIIFLVYYCIGVKPYMHNFWGLTNADVLTNKDFVLNHPLELLQKSYLAIQKYYFIYGMQLVGLLGWINVEFSRTTYFFYFTVFLIMNTYLIFYIKNLYSTFIVVITILATTVLIFTGLFIIWTPLSSETVEGVQGRYFLPLFALLYLCYSYRDDTFYKKLLNVTLFVILITQLYINYPYIIINRFWFVL